MSQVLLLTGVILLISVLSSKLLYRYGVPTLIIFLMIGMMLGSDGIGGIYFDDSILAQQICSVGLAFIIFYGGFSINWSKAKKVVPQSTLLATIGVALTGLLVGLFSFYILKTTLYEGLLLGAIVSSTDAAAVFAILRAKNCILKGNLSQMIEMESASNDPMAYMLTILMISLVTMSTQQSITGLLVTQIFYGFIIGILISIFAVLMLKKVVFQTEGIYPIFVIAIIMIGYSMSEILSGNGILTVFLMGIIIGNNKILHKRSLTHFFDSLSWLMQIVIFFTLGLLIFPNQLPAMFINGLAIALFLLFVARPIVVMLILCWFKVPIKEQLLVSWVGLRGASTIVIATYAFISNISIADKIFDTVFLIALVSLIIQGTLTPKIAKLLGLIEDDIDENEGVHYHEQDTLNLVEVKMEACNEWVGKTILEADIPDDILVVMIKRNGGIISPKATTKINLGDILVLSGNIPKDLKEL